MRRDALPRSLLDAANDSSIGDLRDADSLSQPLDRDGVPPQPPAAQASGEIVPCRLVGLVKDHRERVGMLACREAV